MNEYRMGDITRGLDLAIQQKFLDLTVDNRPVCKDCWARYLCGGGCWKHAVDINGGLEIPDNEFSCEIIRHEIECAMAINSELMVSDKDILIDMYEEGAAPYLVNGKGG
ncbi:MAG: SPASM domain-containing protein [Planctomycetes bacterium]|nr:SPASM domain-containing protein [Planctomycetota bacterium]